MANSCTLGVQRRAYLRHKRFAQAGVVALIGSIFLTSAWVALFTTGRVTLGGVPYTVFVRFWQDQIARDAYFDGNSIVLHDRLGYLGIEYEIKQYYRSRISDPVALDQHIHQILYDRTRYLGEDYTVEQGTLMLKSGRAVKIVACPNC